MDCKETQTDTEPMNIDETTLIDAELPLNFAFSGIPDFNDLLPNSDVGTQTEQTYSEEMKANSSDNCHEDHNETNEMQSPTLISSNYGPSPECTPVSSPCFDDPVTSRSSYDLIKYLSTLDVMPKNYQPDLLALSYEYVHFDCVGYANESVLVKDPKNIEGDDWVPISDVSEAYQLNYRSLRCSTCYHFPRELVQCARCQCSFCGSCLNKQIDLRYSCHFDRNNPIPENEETVHIKTKANYSLKLQYDERLRLICEFDCCDRFGEPIEMSYTEGDQHNMRCERSRCVVCKLYIKNKDEAICGDKDKMWRHLGIFTCLEETKKFAAYLAHFELLKRHMDIEDFEPSKADNPIETNDWKAMYFNEVTDRMEAQDQKAKAEAQVASLTERIKELETKSFSNLGLKEVDSSERYIITDLQRNGTGVSTGFYYTINGGIYHKLEGVDRGTNYRYVREQIKQTMGEQDFDMLDVKMRMRVDREKVFSHHVNGAIINVLPKGLLKPGQTYKLGVSSFDVVESPERVQHKKKKTGGNCRTRSRPQTSTSMDQN